MLRGLFWGVPAPSRVDPSRLIQTPPAAVAISGRLLADVRRFPSGCSALLEVDRIEARGVEGRTELQLPDCPAPLLQGWLVPATGVLRRPLPAAHPLLPGSAERLASQGSWSQLRVESIEVLQRPWTPLADLRRDVAQRLQHDCNRLSGRGGVVSWPPWCWAAPRCSSPQTSERRSGWPVYLMPLRHRDFTSPFCSALC